jgi:hypothetical protein
MEGVYDEAYLDFFVDIFTLRGLGLGGLQGTFAWMVTLLNIGLRIGDLFSLGDYTESSIVLC